MRCRFSAARYRNRRIFSYSLSSDGLIDKLQVVIFASMMRPLSRQFQRPDARRLHTFAGHYQENAMSVPYKGRDGPVEFGMSGATMDTSGS
jgi:hypothetical protein